MRLFYCSLAFVSLFGCVTPQTIEVDRTARGFSSESIEHPGGRICLDYSHAVRHYTWKEPYGTRIRIFKAVSRALSSELSRYFIVLSEGDPRCESARLVILDAVKLELYTRVFWIFPDVMSARIELRFRDLGENGDKDIVTESDFMIMSASSPWASSYREASQFIIPQAIDQAVCRAVQGIIGVPANECSDYPVPYQ